MFVDYPSGPERRHGTKTLGIKKEKSLTFDICASVAQGALYCLLAVHSSVNLASSRDWDCVGEEWPALVRCGLSPTMSLVEPSIGRLLDDITDRIHRQHDTSGIYFTVSSLFSCSQ